MKEKASDSRIGRRSLLVALSVLLLLVLGWILKSDTQARPNMKGKEEGPQGVLAVVQGGVVTEAEVEAAAAADLEKIELEWLQRQAAHLRSKHEAKKKALDRLVEERLVELEAEAAGLSAEELLKREIEDKLVEPTEEDIDAFYEERSKQGQRLPPKERVSAQIRQYLEQTRQREARAALIDALKAKFGVEMYLDELRFDVGSEGPAWGPEDAPVTIVEFSDFECPFCSKVVTTLEQVKKNYPEKVRIVFRQFPLAMHPNAQKAAEASLCADEQGRFWEMHDLMFGEQRKLKVEELKEKAGQLELDVESFGECLDSDRYAEQIQEDLKAGARVGVTGTPALFINGRFLSGARPYEAIAGIIDEELDAAGGS
jgi:protein-disulfide isomerase